MTDEGIELLAEYLAWNEIYDWVMGDHWYGYPDGEDQEEEAMRAALPSARERARKYARILNGEEVD